MNVQLDGNSKKALNLNLLLEYEKQRYISIMGYKFDNNATNFLKKIYDICLPIIAFFGKVIECAMTVVKMLKKLCVLKMGALFEQTIKIFNITIKIFLTVVITDPKQLAAFIEACKAHGITVNVTFEPSVIKV